MKLLTLSLLALFLTACTTLRTTTEADPIALQTGTYWVGVFWVAVAIGAALSIVAWAFAYLVTERARWTADIAKSKADEAKATADTARWETKSQ